MPLKEWQQSGWAPFHNVLLQQTNKTRETHTKTHTDCDKLCPESVRPLLPPPPPITITRPFLPSDKNCPQTFFHPPHSFLVSRNSSQQQQLNQVNADLQTSPSGLLKGFRCVSLLPALPFQCYSWSYSLASFSLCVLSQVYLSLTRTPHCTCSYLCIGFACHLWSKDICNIFALCSSPMKLHRSSFEVPLMLVSICLHLQREIYRVSVK